ncbi:MAG TPA: D-alanyl-D-alanine carboxypeptidase/D-alanyl-D-alanine-endopeptidase [Longimicrobiales bacterium]|nr:D-alanyl-D-alanine carboxypeptidase/D-alanyl-D-alanine-endopeptidase [Longimicrobiales bacterium]
MKALAVVLLALSHAGCASLGGPGHASYRKQIDAVLDAPPLDQVHFGILAVDAASGRTLYARDAHRKFVPASNQKILVTSAALSLLGPGYRYESALWSDGPFADGVLDGDLVLVGTGDPTLSRPFWPSGEEALQALADSLLAAGVRRVTGALVVDATRWDSTTVGPTWEVEDLPFAYGSTGGAFALDHGEITVVARGGEVEGDPATVSWTPLGSHDFVVAHLSTAPSDSSTRVRSDYLPESHKLVLEGRVAAAATDTLRFALRDPVRQAVATLARILDQRGIEVDGGSRVTWDATAAVTAACAAGGSAACPEARRIAGLRSPPLSEIVEAILEPSQNWMTEQLIRTLGAELGDRGSWKAGTDVVTSFLVDEVGIDSLDVAPRDGSGLSAHNLVTPRALVRTLQYMAAGPNGEIYRHAMAEPGEEDSTLERRLTELQGRVFAKTGTISNVNSLSGYLVGQDGREVVFSLLSNGSGLPSSRVRAALDDVIKVLAGIRP